MKVRVLTSIAGISFAYGYGDVVDIDSAEAKRWIDAGFAEAVKGGAPEAATTQPAETATKPRAKSRSKKRKDD